MSAPRIIPAPIRAKLVKPMRLLASSQPGEREGAAHAIARILQAEGFDAHDLVLTFETVEMRVPVGGASPLRPHPPRPRPKPAPERFSHDAVDSRIVLELINSIRRRASYLSDHSIDFLDHMEAKAFEHSIVFFSERQWDFLMGLAKKASVEVD